MVKCANCGEEVLMQKLGDICYYCHKNASKKEVIMQEVNNQAVPPKPRKRKDLALYCEENKEAILADYLALTITLFYSKWRINSNIWMELKKMWAVANKGKGRGSRTKAPKPDNPPDDPDALTEHERYLMLLGYQQAVREFLALK